MTGYLHITDDDRLRDRLALALDSCCKDCALDPAGAQQRNAGKIIEALRGLSVEPTEAGMCGDMGPPGFGGSPIGPCVLRADHTGWHEAASVLNSTYPTRWSHQPPTDRHELLLAAALHLERWAGGDNLASAELRRLAAAPVPVQEDRP